MNKPTHNKAYSNVMTPKQSAKHNAQRLKGFYNNLKVISGDNYPK